VPESEERTLEIKLEVPQGEVLIKESGQYSLITSNSETQISVLQGQALANSGDRRITLLTDQRGVLPSSEQVRGPLDTERNLLVNGDFSRSWEEWVRLGPNIEISDQPPIEMTVSDESGEPALKFERVGIGHADAGIRQIINQDVTDFESLRLVINMRIMNQSLGVCGQQGSECPLIIRIEYTDINGVTQTWQQGLYAVGNVGPDTPDVCVACPPPLNEHEHVTYQQYVFYESENLLEKLGQLNILPRQIESVTVIASGHSFEAELVDVALMVSE
jgi:hypothetical protein